jgi:hypothetical protein
MMSKVIVSLHPAEREALVKLAHSELRSPRNQARYIIRSVLKIHGFLNEDQIQPKDKESKWNLNND